MGEKIFGKMSSEDINETAKNLLETAEFDQIEVLASENGISKEDVEAFIDGASDVLIKPKKDADKKPKKSKATKKEPDVELTPEEIEDIKRKYTYKDYDNTFEKLDIQFEEFFKESKNIQHADMVKAQLEVIKNYILEASFDEEYANRVLLPHKSISSCYRFISSKAKEIAFNGMSGMTCACVSDNVVYGWIDEYFFMDDQEASEKEMKKKIETELQRAKSKKNMKLKKSKSKKSEAVKEKPEENKDKALPETEKKDETENIEGQMNIFDVLGGEQNG